MIIEDFVRNIWILQMLKPIQSYKSRKGLTSYKFKYTINPTLPGSYIFIDEVFQTDILYELIQIFQQKKRPELLFYILHLK